MSCGFHQLSEQEDLIVWMRTAALPTFRKLYGKIETDLEANDEILLEIQNNYNTYSFGGKKTLVLSTATWIGGKNEFLGLAYITIGGLSLFFAVAFIVLYVLKPRSAITMLILYFMVLSLFLYFWNDRLSSNQILHLDYTILVCYCLSEFKCSYIS